jgi:hypothetical protein
MPPQLTVKVMTSAGDWLVVVRADSNRTNKDGLIAAIKSEHALYARRGEVCG